MELVPKSSWGQNLRKILTDDQWDIVRKDCYEKANHICEICGGTGKDQGYLHAVECHEKWDYTIGSPNGHQVLTGVIALCPRCHMVKHMGLTEIRGKKVEAIQHMAHVNEYLVRDAYQDVSLGFVEWGNLNSYSWKVDVSWVEKEYDFKINKDNE